MAHEDITDISLEEVDSFLEADVYCQHCAYRGKVVIENSDWPRYRNPNNKGDSKYDVVCPDAVRLIITSAEVIICPSCDSVGLQIPKHSRFNAKKLLEALKCRKR